MKHNFYVAIKIIITSLVLISCSKDDNGPDLVGKLIGKWNSVSEVRSECDNPDSNGERVCGTDYLCYTYEFTADGNYEKRFTDSNTFIYAATYEVQPPYLILFESNSTNFFLLKLTINGSAMVLSNEDDNDTSSCTSVETFIKI